jgi:hypothetical protein
MFERRCFLATEIIRRVEINPVEPVRLAHHRSLAPGRYSAQAVRGKLYLLFPHGKEGFYPVEWIGNERMIPEFVVTETGDIEKIPVTAQR